MNLQFLRSLDHWLGPLLLQALAPTLRLLQTVFPSRHSASLTELCGRIVVLKLKGGGSLIVAFPALLAIRRAAPQARLTLVCTAETRLYAELLGLFDEFCVIDDRSIPALARSALRTLVTCQRAGLCIDLEINSILASVFTVLTMAGRRLGLVKPEESYRATAYTDSIALNVYAPVYSYYNQLAEILGCKPASVQECRDRLRQQMAPPQPAAGQALGLLPFTSDFAQERMMPPEVWVKLLSRDCPHDITQIKIFGSAKNRPKAELLSRQLAQALPQLQIVNLCGSYTLLESINAISQCRMIWSVDSGLLHVARLLHVPCRSFWGPTMPRQRLQPIDGLDETTDYLNFVCSPCVHLRDGPPCQGNNLCLKSMADPMPNTAPLWRMGESAS